MTMIKTDKEEDMVEEVEEEVKMRQFNRSLSLHN
jgi:hypothetical protein